MLTEPWITTVAGWQMLNAYEAHVAEALQGKAAFIHCTQVELWRYGYYMLLLTRLRFQYDSAPSQSHPFVTNVSAEETIRRIFVVEIALAGVNPVQPRGPNGEVPRGIIGPGTYLWNPDVNMLNGALKLLAKGLPNLEGCWVGWLLSQCIMSRRSFPGYSENRVTTNNLDSSVDLCDRDLGSLYGSEAYSFFIWHLSSNSMARVALAGTVGTRHLSDIIMTATSVGEPSEFGEVFLAVYADLRGVTLDLTFGYFIQRRMLNMGPAPNAFFTVGVGPRLMYMPVPFVYEVANFIGAGRASADFTKSEEITLR